MSENIVPIPRWQSHKIVVADKIVKVTIRPFGEALVKDDTFTDWHLECGAVVHVPHEARRRGGPFPEGGYYVKYEDGFESWSPAEVFEKGYTRMT